MNIMKKINYYLSKIEKLNIVIFLTGKGKYGINLELFSFPNSEEIIFNHPKNIDSSNDLKTFLSKSDRNSTLIFTKIDELTEEISEILLFYLEIEHVIIRLFCFESQDLGENELIKSSIGQRLKHFIFRVNLNTNIQDEYLNSMYHKIIKDKILFKSLSIYEKSSTKFLFFKTKNEYSKIIELRTFLLLLDSLAENNKNENEFDDFNFNNLLENNLLQHFFINNQKFNHLVQTCLKSLNYINIFKIRKIISKLQEELTKFHLKIDRVRDDYSQNKQNIYKENNSLFYFMENLTQMEIIQLIKNINKIILIKDFTTASEKIENLLHNEEENLYATILSFEIKETSTDVLFYNQLNSNGNQNFEKKLAIIKPFSILKIENISIRYKDQNKGYFQIDCTLLNEQEIKNFVKNNSTYEDWGLYISEINSEKLNYSEYKFHLLDFMVNISVNSLDFEFYKREKFLKELEDALNTNRISFKGFNRSDYFLLGRIYNMLGEYQKSNMYFKRYKFSKYDTYNNLACNSSTDAYFNINMASISLEDLNDPVSAWEYLSLAMNNLKTNEFLKYEKIILEKIINFKRIAFFKKFQEYGLSMINIDEIGYINNNSYLDDFLMRYHIMRGNSDMALRYYKELITLNLGKNYSEIDPNFPTYKNIFIGAIHANIFLGIYSNYVYYTSSSIAGYVSFKNYLKYVKENKKNEIPIELNISLDKTSIHDYHINILIQDGLLYYPCYYINDHVIENLKIISIFPFTIIESIGNNTILIKKNTILEILSDTSIEILKSKYFLFFKNFFNISENKYHILENVHSTKNLMEVLKELIHLILCYNHLKKFGILKFINEHKIFIQLYNLISKILKNVMLIMSLPQFDLLGIINNFKRSKDKYMKMIFFLFYLTLKVSIGLIKEYSLHRSNKYLYDSSITKVIELLESKIPYYILNIKKEDTHKFKSVILKKLDDEKISFSEFVKQIEIKFCKRDKIVKYLLKSFIIKYINNLMYKKLLDNFPIEDIEIILNKNIDFLRCDGKNSINIFFHKKIINIYKIKQKINILNSQKTIAEIIRNRNKESSNSAFKLKFHQNKLKEELMDLLRIIQNKFSFFLFSVKNTSSLILNILKMISPHFTKFLESCDSKELNPFNFKNEIYELTMQEMKTFLR